MLRAAAKNYESVLPVVDPKDYGRVLQMLRDGTLTRECRRALAAKVFGHVADYDAAIAAYLTTPDDHMPARLNLSLERVMPLRYGENPHQQAALYATEEPRGIRDLRQLQGKELSFNNLLDIEAATTSANGWANRPACAVIKHTTPCGIAVRPHRPRGAAARPRHRPRLRLRRGHRLEHCASTARSRRRSPTSSSRSSSRPTVHEDALAVFASRKNLRVCEFPASCRRRDLRLEAGAGRLPDPGTLRLRPLGGGLDRLRPPASRRRRSGPISGSRGPRCRA